MTVSGERRIREAFDRSAGSAFMPYVLAGYPDVATSIRYASAVARHCDLIELGIPFSDPLADGPTIQAAGQVALDAGCTPRDVLRVAEALRDGPPVVLMTYLNTVLAPGERTFFQEAAAAGVAGIIVPDLPVEESDTVREAANASGIALIAFAAPTSSDQRIAMASEAAQGFVYCVAVAGVTGGGLTVDDELEGFLGRVSAASRVPTAVGFGVRTPGDARRVGRLADGVIIGSEIIRVIDQAASPAAAERALEEYAASIQGALAEDAGKH